MTRTSGPRSFLSLLNPNPTTKPASESFRFTSSTNAQTKTHTKVQSPPRKLIPPTLPFKPQPQPQADNQFYIQIIPVHIFDISTDYDTDTTATASFPHPNQQSITYPAPAVSPIFIHIQHPNSTHLARPVDADLFLPFLSLNGRCWLWDLLLDMWQAGAEAVGVLANIHYSDHRPLKFHNHHGDRDRLTSTALTLSLLGMSPQAQNQGQGEQRIYKRRRSAYNAPKSLLRLQSHQVATILSLPVKTGLSGSHTSLAGSSPSRSHLATSSSSRPGAYSDSNTASSLSPTAPGDVSMSENEGDSNGNFDTDMEMEMRASTGRVGTGA
ncbi:hypothetical protein BU17DRAFT_96975 [Hysterangium stoloniferum]|nr:hypothetical protein BU17DRAFT_96975 [Hysterangium stoloniferum]